jgi:hypothetical protein
MVNRILASFIVADALFVLCGGLLLAVVLVTRGKLNDGENIDNVKEMVLLAHCPLTGSSLSPPSPHRRDGPCTNSHIAGLVNSGLIFFTFFLSIPALILPDNRRWLKIHGWFVVICALFTLVLGLDIWFHTLKTRAYLGVIWEQQPVRVQSLLQESVYLPFSPGVPLSTWNGCN